MKKLSVLVTAGLFALNAALPATALATQTPSGISGNSFIGLTSTDDAGVSRNGYYTWNSNTTSAFVVQGGFGAYHIGSTGGLFDVRVYVSQPSTGDKISCFLTAVDMSNGAETSVSGTAAGAGPTVVHLILDANANKFYTVGVICALPKSPSAGVFNKVYGATIDAPQGV